MRRPPNLVKDTRASAAAPAPRSADREAPANYLDLYGLSKPPFAGGPGHAGYILFGTHRRTFETLIDHTVNGTGLLMLQGMEGVGKTETLHSAAAVAGDSGVPIIMVTRPPGGRMDLPALMAALGDEPAGNDRTTFDPVEHFLRQPRKALLIDDFDLMPDDCVEFLGTLLQTMTTSSSGSVVILSTTSDLTSNTARPRMSQIIELARHTLSLLPLGPADIRQYIERSLWVSGGTTRRLISTDALKLIIARSGGLPGVVDRLMEAAFTAGYARGDRMITAKTVAAAMGPTARRPIRSDSDQTGPAGRAAQIISVALLLVGTAMFLYRGLAGHDPRANPPAANPLAAKSSPLKPPAPKPVEAMAPSPPATTNTPPNQSRAATSTEAVAPALIAALIKRGDQSRELGDIAAARLLFQRAADAGSAAAATALGKSYDPNYVPTGGWADPARATEFYRKAMALGDPHAEDLLKAMPTH